MANYFLGSVGKAEAFRVVNSRTTKGEKELELAFVSKTLTDSGVNISITADEIRAGQGAPVVAKFFHDPSAEITLTDVMYKNAYVEAQLGAKFEVGGPAYQTEVLPATNGKITLSKEAEPLTGSCFDVEKIYAWATPEGKNEWKMVEVGNDKKSVDLGDTSAEGNYCVRYLALDTSAEVAEIYADLVPEELHLIITVPLYAGDACAASNGKAAGEVQFDIPRFRLNGAQDFAASMSSNQTMSLAGTAQAIEGGCDSSSKLMNITQKLFNHNIFDDIESIVIDPNLEPGDTLVVYGIKKDNSVTRIDNGALTIKPANVLTIPASGTAVTVSVAGYNKLTSTLNNGAE